MSFPLYRFGANSGISGGYCHYKTGRRDGGASLEPRVILGSGGTMRLRNAAFAGLAGLSLFSAIYAFHQPFREYTGVEYENFPLPSDYQEKTEWVFARLMYPPIGRAYGGVGFFCGRGPRPAHSGMGYSPPPPHLSPGVWRLSARPCASG